MNIVKLVGKKTDICQAVLCLGCYEKASDIPTWQVAVIVAKEWFHKCCQCNWGDLPDGEEGVWENHAV